MKGKAGEVRAQLQVALDQQYLTSDEHARPNDLCRKTSGMSSNFIAHLQSSEYRGEKFSRPQRQAVEAAQTRQETLLAIQLRNMHSSQTQEPTDPS